MKIWKTLFKPKFEILPTSSMNEDMIPYYENEGDSGLDLKAAINKETTIIIPPLQSTLIPTGIKLSMRNGYEAQIRSRSGLALKNKIFVLNSPGTIDSRYEDEIKVIIFNLGTEHFRIERGDRIAQMVFQRIERIKGLDKKGVRGKGGFGSTGVSN